MENFAEALEFQFSLLMVAAVQFFFFLLFFFVGRHVDRCHAVRKREKKKNAVCKLLFYLIVGR